MKKILLCFVVMFIIGCKPQNVEVNETGFILRPDAPPMNIVIIDSCEYLYGPWGSNTVFSHKGNCKNPQHER